MAAAAGVRPTSCAATASEGKRSPLTLLASFPSLEFFKHMNHPATATAAKEKPAPTCPKGLVHRGFFHGRVAYDQSLRNNRRETAFAKAWEEENTHIGTRSHITGGRQGLLDALMTKDTIKVLGNSGYPQLERVGVYDQNAAAVAATVVQWLGTNIGFDFLANVLSDAGYDIVDRESGRPLAVASRGGKRS